MGLPTVRRSLSALCLSKNQKASLLGSSTVSTKTIRGSVHRARRTYYGIRARLGGGISFCEGVGVVYPKLGRVSPFSYHRGVGCEPIGSSPTGKVPRRNKGVGVSVEGVGKQGHADVGQSVGRGVGALDW